jgi:hypothetical protein
MMYRVKDLSPEQKNAVEGLIGHSISEDESVSVKLLPPTATAPSRLTSEQRKAAVENLNRYFARVDARSQSLTDEEEEAIFSEAMRSTRPNYRPVD